MILEYVQDYGMGSLLVATAGAVLRLLDQPRELRELGKRADLQPNPGGGINRLERVARVSQSAQPEADDNWVGRSAGWVVVRVGAVSTRCHCAGRGTVRMV